MGTVIRITRFVLFRDLQSLLFSFAGIKINVI